MNNFYERSYLHDFQVNELIFLEKKKKVPPFPLIVRQYNLTTVKSHATSKMGVGHRTKVIALTI